MDAEIFASGFCPGRRDTMHAWRETADDGFTYAYPSVTQAGMAAPRIPNVVKLAVSRSMAAMIQRAINSTSRVTLSRAIILPPSSICEQASTKYSKIGLT